MLSFDPYSPAVDADPFPYYKRLRDEAPCFWSREAEMWVLSRYADIVTAGQDWRTYSSASGNMMTELPDRAGATLGTTDPPRHDRLRALVQYAFMKRNLEGLAEPIRAIATGAAEDLRGETTFDFKDYSAKFTVRVLMAALGLPSGDEAIVDEDTVRVPRRLHRPHRDQDRLRGVPQSDPPLQPRRRPAPVDAVVDVPQPAGAGACGSLVRLAPRAFHSASLGALLMAKITYVDWGGR